jgi:glutaredoxin-like protein NrdH
MVTVYTNPNCVQCEQTKRYLNLNEVEYSTIDLSTDEKSLEMVLGLGFKAAPVVITDDDMWSGFRLDNLSKLVESLRTDE